MVPDRLGPPGVETEPEKGLRIPDSGVDPDYLLPMIEPRKNRKKRGDRGRAGLLAILVMVIALAVTAVPASAKPGGGQGGGKPAGGSGGGNSSASMRMSIDTFWEFGAPGCVYEAAYSWSGFGRGLNYGARLLDRNGATLAITPQVQSVPGSGNYSFYFVFSGTPTGQPRDIYARGSLLSGGVDVSGSVANSPILTTTCTGTVSVRWLWTIPLT